MKFNGSIEYIDFNILTEIIKETFPQEKVVDKIRIIGEEISIQSISIELYGHNQMHNSTKYVDNKGSFVIQGNIKLELVESLREINSIMSNALKKGYHYNIDIYPDVNDESFELNLRSPGYDIYMNQMSKKHGS